MEANIERYDIHILEPEEKIESFDCGDADLNDFILSDAFLYHLQQPTWYRIGIRVIPLLFLAWLRIKFR